MSVREEKRERQERKERNANVFLGVTVREEKCLTSCTAIHKLRGDCFLTVLVRCQLMKRSVVKTEFDFQVHTVPREKTSIVGVTKTALSSPRPTPYF